MYNYNMGTSYVQMNGLLHRELITQYVTIDIYTCIACIKVFLIMILLDSVTLITIHTKLLTFINLQFNLISLDKKQS